MPTPSPERRSPGPRDPAPAPDERRLGVSGTQVATSALASVSAAFVASLFGVAGTIAGAAVVSVVATVGTAVYGRSIRRTTARLQQVPRRAVTRGGPAAVATGEAGDAGDAGDGRPPGETPDAAPDAGGGPVELDFPPAGPGWWVRSGRRRWGLAAGVAVVLALSVGAISVIEFVGGQPLSGEASGGRTSIGALLPGGGGEDDDDGEGELPDDDGTGTTTDPTAPATTAPGEGDGTGDTVPPAGVATTTSSTAGTTTTMAPPATQPTVEPQATPEG